MNISNKKPAFLYEQTHQFHSILQYKLYLGSIENWIENKTIIFGVSACALLLLGTGLSHNVHVIVIYLTFFCSSKMKISIETWFYQIIKIAQRVNIKYGSNYACENLVIVAF